MLSEVSVFLILLAVNTSYSFPTFHSRTENIQKNEIVGCEMEDFLNILRLVETIARRKGISPFILLRKLNKENMEEDMINTLSPMINLPPVMNVIPEANRAPYSLSPDTEIDKRNNDDTEVFVIPAVPSPFNRTQAMMKPEQKMRTAHNISPLVGKLNNMLPEVFVKNNQIKPPIEVTVRMNSADPLSPLSRDIVVTVSPFMTLTEALRQAEIKYQDIFGLSHDTKIITFAHSPATDCYIVNRVNDVVRNDNWGWKITVEDKEGQVVYDSFCLPNSKEVFVKPGTTIFLTFVPL